MKGKKGETIKARGLISIGPNITALCWHLTKGNEVKSDLAVLDSYDFEELVLGFGGEKHLENSKE